MLHNVFSQNQPSCAQRSTVPASYHLELRLVQAQTELGSIMDLSWTADGTQLAGAGSNGRICFAQLVGLTAEVGSTRALLATKSTVKVYNILEETSDELDFKDRVIKMCLGEVLMSHRT